MFIFVSVESNWVKPGCAEPKPRPEKCAEWLRNCRVCSAALCHRASLCLSGFSTQPWHELRAEQRLCLHVCECEYVVCTTLSGRFHDCVVSISTQSYQLTIGAARDLNLKTGQKIPSKIPETFRRNFSSRIWEIFQIHFYPILMHGMHKQSF